MAGLVADEAGNRSDAVSLLEFLHSTLGIIAEVSGDYRFHITAFIY